ncbi:MAG: 2-C-methyl-D-erythritol 4-phosphate cytidylyltransferase [Acidobacteriota bacterium]
MTVAALIVAAGRGTRFGAPFPKAHLSLAGCPILARAVAAFADHPRIDRVVAVVPDTARSRQFLRPSDRDRVLLVRGGAERGESVRHGLEALADASVVLVHDAARPLVPPELIDAVLEATLRSGAAVPAIPVPDTVKRASAEGAVAATVPREGLVLAQTPQGFRVSLLCAAYERAARDGFEGTDDASVVEHSGGAVTLVEGDPRNFKITTRDDLALAEAILAARPRRGGAEPEGG